ncbi:restriction endonuclease subunit S [Actinoallomurus soli]|uniref:restriction endonuclease subunit S n=1 Tax=Actinoallomurus soli TaxID=2952535 RepID=UPI002093A6A5|nr:restriction endonuclease subunit S [Actinoallomurus soli]MCO5967501.1 restriction endonuclease subunit S [Actinoallomurus soli]
MKPVSLGWTSEIPAHWDVVPLKFVAKMGTGHTPDRNKEEYWEHCTIPWVTIPDLTSRFDSLSPLMDTEQRISELGMANSAAVLHPRDTVMLSRTASIGHSVRIGRPMATTQAFVTWSPGARLDSGYLLLVLHAMKQEWEKLAYGSTHLTIYMPDLESIRIPLPPLEEQRRIAAFVNMQAGKISKLIARKRRLVALMNERIDSQILQYVGASKIVKSRTGTPVLPIRRLLRKAYRAPLPNAGIITAYRDGQVTERSLRRAEGYTLSASAEPQGQYVKVGDVVIHGLDGFAGSIGTAEASGNCTPVYHVCTPVGAGDSRFLGRMLRLLALQGYLGNFATSTRERAVDFRNWDLFGRIPIPVVSNDEQREIGNSISRLRPLAQKVERFESAAAERRQALIHAAVTGQLDVTTAIGAVTEGSLS